jgi:hypothetical protein
MRDKYFALNDRPICATCRPKYAEKIARTDGKGALWRIGLHGAAVAGIGAVVLALASSAITPLSIVCFLPIGYFVGKRMIKVLDGYSARRYQYLAVGLTYLSFLVGMGMPAMVKARRALVDAAVTQAGMANIPSAPQADQAAAEPTATDPAASEPEPVAAAGEEPAAEEPEAEKPTAKPAVPDIGPGPGLAFAMFLLLPIVAQLPYGIGLASTAMLSILGALYQAWTRTDGQGMRLTLRGPFRVGQGPIQAR